VGMDTVRRTAQPVMRRRTDIGIVFQNPLLFDWRRAPDNETLQVEARRLDNTCGRHKRSKPTESPEREANCERLDHGEYESS
jgi:ABC-type nitrate/sulfonate/bicarbonate transport system ATPase subunit